MYDDQPVHPAPAPNSDPVALLDQVPVSEELTAEEAGYIAAARAQNTVRGYKTDWREFSTWCTEHDHDPLPATLTAISRYLTCLAGHGAKVGTMSSPRSDSPTSCASCDPCEHPRVLAVWEGIRRVHGAPPVQSDPLMPPELFAVVDACPTVRTRADPTRTPEPHLGGARDRVRLLVGFVAALRRSELAAIDVEHLQPHPNGLVLTLPRSKTTQTGQSTELVVPPRAGNRARCPVTAITTWRDLAGITTGPLLRPVSRGNRATDRRLSPAAVNSLVAAAVARAGLDPAGYSAHSLRAGFVTYVHLRGISDRAIAHQTPVPGHPRHLHQGRERLGLQRRHPARPLGCTPWTSMTIPGVDETG